MEVMHHHHSLLTNQFPVCVCVCAHVRARVLCVCVCDKEVVYPLHY